MKRPIDPSLDSFDDELFGSVEEKLKDIPKEKENITADSQHISRSIYDLVDDEVKTDGAMAIKETPISENKPHHHHHHHHHHSSSSSGSHSSSSHSSSSHSSGSHSSSSHSSSSHSSGSHSSSSHSKKSSSRSRSSKKKDDKKKKSPAAKIAIAILAIILALLLIVTGTLGGLYLRGRSDLKPAESESYNETIKYNGHTYEFNNDVIAFAVMGIDKRELGLEEAGVGTAGQADMCMVAGLNKKTGEVKLIAVPRDTMVEVDQYTTSGFLVGTQEMQLCLSYAYGDGYEGSAQNTMTSLSRVLLNVPIEKYFALDLDGIAPLNDTIGGVDIDNALFSIPEYNIVEGKSVHLEGDMTEAYVRQRSMDNIEASLNRTERQIQYLKAYAAQLAPAVINDFGTVNRLYNLASRYSTTNVSVSNATYLASLLLRNGVTDFETYRIEGEMKASEVKDEKGTVYAEFYPDEDSLYNAVLGTFYTQVD